MTGTLTQPGFLGKQERLVPAIRFGLLLLPGSAPRSTRLARTDGQSRAGPFCTLDPGPDIHTLIASGDLCDVPIRRV